MLITNLILLDSAGIINLFYDGTVTRMTVITAATLTWEGHEFLEAARDEKRWKKVVTDIVKKTGSLSYELLKAWLIQVMKVNLFGSQ
jgi:hypothetical protein